MCGRFSLKINASELEDETGVKAEVKQEPSFNIAPQQLILALPSAEKEALRMRQWSWGWSLPLAAGSRFVINARSETAAEKRSFARAYREARCVIPATGFFEWDRRLKEKRTQPYHFQRKDGKPFWLAGLWRQESTESIPEFVLMTTEANEVMAPIHHRLPVILEAEAYRSWIDPSASLKTLKELSRPISFNEWEHWQVSPEVNKVIHNSPELLKPWKSDTEQLDLFS